MTAIKLQVTKVLVGVSAIFSSTMQNRAEITSVNLLRKIGPAYFVDLQPGTGILYTMEEKNQDGFHYYLQLNDAKNNSILKKKKIFFQQEPASAEKIIGSMDNNIWILGDSLLAYDMSSLQPVITETMIAERNPFMANNFSRFTNSYLLDEVAHVLYINTGSGDGYRLYTDGLKMKPDSGSSDNAPEEYSYEFAAEYKVNNRYEIKFALSNIDSAENKLYILGSDKETGQVISYFGTAIYPERDELRKLTIFPFGKINEEKIDKAARPFRKKSSYYKGGFLNKKFTTNAWHGKDSERIIIHFKKQNVGYKLAAAMVDKDGNEKWQANTNISLTNFTDYLVNSEYLVLFKDASSATGAGFTVIDLASGKSNNYLYY